MARLKTILVIEADPPLLHTLSEILKHQGFLVTSESEKKDIFHILKNINFDLIMAELSLSEAKDFELLKEIHSLYPEIPVIILSGEQTPFGVQAVKELGICCYLTKPIDPSEIIQRVQEALSI